MQPPFVPAERLASDVKAELMRALPKLRAFAVSLCGRSGGRAERPDDLVQRNHRESPVEYQLIRARTNHDGMALHILRNEFYTEYRKHRREIQDEDGVHPPPTA